MINAWNLVWIIPLCVCVGIVIHGIVSAGRYDE